MSGGVGGGAGGVGGGATMGPIIPSSTLSSLVNMREQVTLTRSELEKFYTNEAKNFGMAIGEHVIDPSKVATGDLADFYSQVNGVGVKVEEVNPKLDLMGKMFAFSMIKEASAAVKQFGLDLASVLNEGVTRAASAQSIGIDLKNALIINKDGTILDESNTVSVDKLNGVMGNLSKTAQDIGLKTMFSDVEIMKVMEHLAANGINASTILDGGARSVAYLAQATKSELTPTVETITAIMHGMGKTLQKDFGEDTNTALMSVADTLTNIKLTTGESLEQIGNTMKYVGPIADELQVPFKDLAVSVDVLARSGIRGSQAGTALRRMFTNLTPTSDKAAAAMKDLGLITADGTNRFYDQTGKMKSLSEVQTLLYDSMHNLSDEQRIYALRTIFGQYAMQSMAKIAGTTPAEFAKLSDKINQSGTAMRMGEQQMLSYSGQMDVMNENINIAKKQLGDALLPILTPLITKLGELFAWFSNLSPETKRFIAVFAGLVAVIAIVVGVVGGAIAAFALFNIALTLAGVSLAAIAWPVTLIVLGIAALIAIGVLLWQNWDTIKAKSSEIWTAITTSVGAFFVGVGRWFAELPAKTLAGLVAFGTWLGTNIASAWVGITTWLSSMWTSISTWFTALPGKAMSVLTTFGTWLASNVKSAWTGIVTWTTDTWNAIKAWFASLPTKLAYSIGFVAGWLYTTIKNDWSAFTKWTAETWTAIAAWFTSLPAKFLTAITSVATWLSTNVPLAWTAFTTWLASVWTAISTWFTSLPAKFLAVIQTFATWLTTNVMLAFTAFTTWLASVWTAISTWFVELPGKFITAITTFASWLYGAISSNWTGFKTWLSDTWTAISTWFTELPAKMLATLTGLITKIVDVGKAIGNAIWDGIKSVLSGVADYVVNMVHRAIDAAKNLWESVKSGFTGGAGATNGKSSGDSGSDDTQAHAAGGIFDRPTRIGNHLFGERGPEALVPLSKWNMMTEGFNVPSGRRDVDMGGASGGRGQTIVQATFVYQGGGNAGRNDSEFKRFADIVVGKIGSVN